MLLRDAPRRRGSWSVTGDSSSLKFESGTEGSGTAGLWLMGDPLLVAVAALGLSLGISAIRLIHWFIHSDPKAVARAARWAVIGLAALSVPLLLVLLLTQHWAAAIGLAAVMVLALAWYGPRLVQQPF